ITKSGGSARVGATGGVPGAPASRSETVNVYPAVPKTNLSISNPSSRAPIWKVCVRFPGVTVKAGPDANWERLIHFHTCVPAEPPPVTTSVATVKPTFARLLTRIQSVVVVGDLFPNPFA